VVERYDSIKCADSSNMLGRFPDQAWVNGSGGIHAERIEAKFPQMANQAAVTTADVEDSRARRKGRRDRRVESFHYRESAIRRNVLAASRETWADRWIAPVSYGSATAERRE
jgi:hypothetical protein